jgi:hypothetical protein
VARRLEHAGEPLDLRFAPSCATAYFVSLDRIE